MAYLGFLFRGDGRYKVIIEMWRLLWGFGGMPEEIFFEMVQFNWCVLGV